MKSIEEETKALEQRIATVVYREVCIACLKERGGLSSNEREEIRRAINRFKLKWTTKGE